jgi:carbamoyltransferase
MKILGISAFYHDSAAALVMDGEIVAAAQEERFTRKKHDSAFPHKAIEFCLQQAGCDISEIDYIAFYEKPFLKFERLLETYLAFAPKGYKSFAMAMPLWIREKLFQKDLIIKNLQKHGDFKYSENKIMFTEHHQSHASSAFFPSPYEEALVLTMDGVGEWATTSVAHGKGNKLTMLKELHFPSSLGMLYSAFTYYTGFKVNSGEYKVMGLAPYGEPKYVDVILNNLMDLKEDGSFRLNMKYFDYCTGLTMTNDAFAELFGAPARTSETNLTQREMDLAASIQKVCEIVVLKMAAALAKEYKIPNLCLAGGVALNCVANGKLLREGLFKNIYVQPAAGDAGGALGAALSVWLEYLEKPRIPSPEDSMKGSYLGPVFAQDDIEARLTKIGAVFEKYNTETMLEKAADALANGMALGWHQGRMEYGPRALGGRSIIADPRDPEMQKKLNLKVKFRESFRPFAPSILAEKVGEWFDHTSESPYMLMVADVLPKHRIKMTGEQEKLFGIDKLNVPRSSIPAITHVDYSARIQTVHEGTNPLYYKLISKFNDKTGCPVLVNTSFNVRGEPIVCTPEDSFHCFMGTELDMLVIGNFILRKEAQPENLKQDYKELFELD